MTEEIKTDQFNIRLPVPVIDALTRLGTEKGLSAQMMARMILSEATKEERQAA